MRKFGIAIATLALVGFAGGGAWAQSAKFAADWATDDVTIAEVQVGPCDVDCNAEVINANVALAELMATMKVPQSKEALIGVSGEASLATFTEAKGKNGGGEVTSSAEATIELTVKLAPSSYEPVNGVCVDVDPVIIEAAPGPVTFASRIQTIALDIAGFEDADAQEGQIKLALDQQTVAAHHFNFVAANLVSDEYDIYACFGGKAVANVVIADDGEGSAAATAVIQKRMLTAQQVRAVNGTLEP